MNKKSRFSRKAVIISLLVVLTALVVSFCLTGCGNRQLIDTTYTFDYGIVSLPNGEVVEGPVQSWKDFDDGDMIQVKIDGVVYLTHSMNVCIEAR